MNDLTDEIRADAPRPGPWLDNLRALIDNPDLGPADKLHAIWEMIPDPVTAAPAAAPPRPAITARVLAADTQMTETSDAGLGITVNRTYTTTLQVRVPTRSLTNIDMTREVTITQEPHHDPR